MTFSHATLLTLFLIALSTQPLHAQRHHLHDSHAHHSNSNALVLGTIVSIAGRLIAESSRPHAYDPYQYRAHVPAIATRPVGYGYSYGGYDCPLTGRSYGYVRPSNYYFLPPTSVPAELNYGPQAMKRFMGLPPNYPAPAGNLSNRATIPNIVATPAKPRVANFETRERALHFQRQGDQLFAKQKAHEALQQYKKATQTAPDLTSGYIRQGFALIATNRYELATEAFKRGLQFDPGYVTKGFQADEIYGENQIAKNGHLDGLARTALTKESDPDLLFLVGAFLHFDEEPERAGKFFAKAVELERGDIAHLNAFLSPVAAP